ncbi:rRNA-processing protein utp21 [Elasticomyces elasticus]|nr:hypothetical protein LTR28_007511 [Elasticomyces elasticus]KAK4986200.1 rRNA-processing protein utp21 [Elasticomyces elasticus]
MSTAVASVNNGDGPVAKRQKLEANGVQRKVQRKLGASRLFAPYRTVGLVSPTAVPFTSIPLGKTTFQITTSVGRSLQTYDLRKGLNLVFITRPQTPEIITSSLAWNGCVLAAWGGLEPTSARGIWVFKRGKKVAELEIPPSVTENVQMIHTFGSWIVACLASQLLVFKSTTFELYTALQGLPGATYTGCVTSMPTFLNKILVGKNDGSVEIWNTSSGKMVYTILPHSSAYGAVTALQPTPVLGLCAIAYQSGLVVIHAIREDRQVTILNRGPSSVGGTAITSISFRSDGIGAGEDGRKAGVMATSSTASSDITLWDLNNYGRKAGVLRGAHASPSASAAGGISKIEFLPGQAVLVSSGLDNALKTWIFDETPFSPIPRILHSRSGHGGSVTKLMFLPVNSDGSDDRGKWLLSASHDRSLWGWSLRRDGQSTELSQGSVRKRAKKAGILASEGRERLEDLKAPSVTCIACSLNRDGGVGVVPGKQAIWETATKRKGNNAESSGMTGWESVITGHEGDKMARTWFWGRKRAGRWAFETGDGGEVKSVAISPCGTFALVGSAAGSIDMFNLQSGMHRQRFPARLTPAQARQLKLDLQLAEENVAPSVESRKNKFHRGLGKHSAAVTGIAVDSLNKTVISCGQDGRVKFWEFGTGLLLHELDWSGAVSILGLRYHRSSDLVAFSCSDGCIRVIDIATRKLIRELWSAQSLPLIPKSPNTGDFSFSNDGRWIVAAFSSFVFAWDLPTGHLIDAFRLPAECTALSFSPTGEYFATSLVDGVGVDIWSNRTLFTHVPTRHISKEDLASIVSSTATTLTTLGEGGELPIDLLADEHEEEEEDETGLDTGDLPPPDIDQLSQDLISLSLVPKSRWQNLLHLDLIRQRNRPMAPPEKPKKAPFFLPSLQDRQAARPKDADTETALTLGTEKSRLVKMDREGNRSKFQSSLQAAARTEEYASLIEYLKTLNPSAADVEIRSLDAGASFGSSGSNELVTFVKALTFLLRQKKDFELGQAWMAVFLRLHADVAVEDDELREAIEEWKGALEMEKGRLVGLAEYCGGVVAFMRAARV